jgi:hypothetical protein
MATVDWDLHYDRRASVDFLAHFLPGGVAASLAEYARYAPYPVDLQMRKNPRTGTQHATVYVGLTSVLQVTHVKPNLLTLRGHKNLTGKHNAFDPTWSTPMTVEDIGKRWRAVEGYLEEVIPLATPKHANKEGAVQAAVSVFSADERVMVDREVALSFKDTPTKTKIFEMLTAPYLEALKNVAGVPGQRPTSFGGECDLLAVDARGRLLAVEIKPRDVASIAWAGIQATIYAELFTRWLKSPRYAAVDRPAVIIRDMLDQRTRLNLASRSRALLPDDPEVVPVLALQRDTRPAYLERLSSVQKTIRDTPGCAGTNLEVYEVSMTGRLHPLAL